MTTTILSLQNWTHERGVDQVLEVAKLMPADHFLIAGEPLDGYLLPTPSNNVEFLGTVEPIEVIANADVLVRFSRLNDPWGRDIIEALSMGVPVVTTGNSQLLVTHGVNGYLIGDFEAGKAMGYVRLASELRFAPDTRFTGKNVREIEEIYADCFLDP
jgi:glycosyltransferase involved in cell wall biosynthesis